MRFVIDDKAKIIELWFKNGENPVGIIPPEIEPIISVYRKRKYLICLYQSGKGDLRSLTSRLLVSNVKAMTNLKGR